MYVTVLDECLDEKHDQCPKLVDIPTREEIAEGFTGGGMCICLCHDEETPPGWYQSVKANAIEARKTRGQPRNP